MPRTFVEAHLDLPAIEADIAAIKPLSITLDGVLELLKPQIIAASRRGVTPEQIRDSLKTHGIIVSAAAIARIAAGDDAPPKKKSSRQATNATQPPAPAEPAAGDAGAERSLV
ncbi:MAG: hypothetical protein OXD40_05665 [bacterium]|nr:hypothetical protein [bacterium]